MTTKIETYYDFRSPYAYFANYRVRGGNLGFAKNVEWVGRPIFIDVILNLQAGREPWAPYIDTLIPPKRAYLMADIRRMAQFYGAPYRSILEVAISAKSNSCTLRGIITFRKG